MQLKYKYNSYSHSMEKSCANVCSLAPFYFNFYSRPLLLTATFVGAVLFALLGPHVAVALLVILVTLFGCWFGVPFGPS